MKHISLSELLRLRKYAQCYRIHGKVPGNEKKNVRNIEYNFPFTITLTEAQLIVSFNTALY